MTNVYQVGPTDQQFTANLANGWPIGPILCVVARCPQGVALGWVNIGPLAHNISLHSTVLTLTLSQRERGYFAKVQLKTSVTLLFSPLPVSPSNRNPDR
jgi:hypothetical protein